MISLNVCMPSGILGGILIDIPFRILDTVDILASGILEEWDKRVEAYQGLRPIRIIWTMAAP